MLGVRNRRHHAASNQHQRANADPSVRHMQQIRAISDAREENDKAEDVQRKRRHGGTPKNAQCGNGRGSGWFRTHAATRAFTGRLEGLDGRAFAAFATLVYC